MDAFAVSVTLGISRTKSDVWRVFVPPLYFGFFQALMPLIGFYAGTLFADLITNLDHWVAFILLGFIGVKMIRDSLSGEKTSGADYSGFVRMLALALATSIDALAVGITFAFFKINIFTAITITGLTTFGISLGGMIIGRRFGAKLSSGAEFTGGLILLILGFRILIEHLIHN